MENNSINKNLFSNKNIEEKSKYINNLPKIDLNKKYINIKEINTEKDYKDIFNFINENKDFKKYVSKKYSDIKDFETFKKEINLWFKTDTNFIFLINDKNINMIGFVMFYNINLKKDTVKVSNIFSKEKRGTKMVIEMYISIIEITLDILKISNIEFSVYKENIYVLDMYKFKYKRKWRRSLYFFIK